jgi:nucleoside-diphosphate-sugar epimerase
MTNHTDLQVIFGTGPVGLAIMDALHARGYTNIRLVNRSGKPAETLPPGIELLAGDASDPTFTTQVAARAAVMYNALNPPYSKWVECFPALQAAVVAAAAAHTARLVVMDNMYMYGDPHGQSMTEDSPHHPHTKKGRLRAQMARDLMTAHNAGRVPVVVGRASDFIGPRVRVSTMGRDVVFKPALRGKAAQVFGNVDVPHSYTYVPDIGRALVTLAEHPAAFGRVWHLPTPPAVSTRSLLQMIYDETGHPLHMQRIPAWLLRGVGIFNPDAGEMVEMLYQFNRPFISDDSAFVARFGWAATDLRTVVRDTVAWYRARPD